MTFDSGDKPKIHIRRDFDFGDGIDHYGTKQAETARRFTRHKMSDMQNHKSPNWLIRDLIFERQIGVCYAPPQQFKSFLVHALGSMLVHGMEWQGRLLKSRRVIYVAGEGFPMFYFRRLAWFKHHRMPPDDDGFEVIEGAVDLTKAEDVADFIVEMQKDVDDVGLIVFDTLSTCSAGQNESDSAVMTSVVENGKLIARKLDCAVLFVHHPGKDIARGARGHSSLFGNIDFEWTIEREGMTCKLTVTKQKDGENGLVFHFQAFRIPLGILDEDGIERTSLALASCTAPQQNTQVADRISVAAVMRIGETKSLTALAKKMGQFFGSKPRTGIERIKAAVPNDWTKTRKAETFVEIRRVDAPSIGKAAAIEMREWREG